MVSMLDSGKETIDQRKTSCRSSVDWNITFNAGRSPQLQPTTEREKWKLLKIAVESAWDFDRLFVLHTFCVCPIERKIDKEAKDWQVFDRKNQTPWADMREFSRSTVLYLIRSWIVLSRLLRCGFPPSVMTTEIFIDPQWFTKARDRGSSSLEHIAEINLFRKFHLADGD